MKQKMKAIFFKHFLTIVEELKAVGNIFVAREIIQSA